MPHGERKKEEPETEAMKEHREQIQRMISGMSSVGKSPEAEAHESSVQKAQKKQTKKQESIYTILKNRSKKIKEALGE